MERNIDNITLLSVLLFESNDFFETYSFAATLFHSIFNILTVDSR